MDLLLYNKRCEELKRKQNKARELDNSETSSKTANVIKSGLNTEKFNLPLAHSPEYIWLRKSREKRSGSLSSLPDTYSMSQSLSSDEDSSASATDSASRGEKQQAWVKSVCQGKSSKC